MFDRLRHALSIVMVSLGVFYAGLSVFTYNYEGILIWCLVTYAGYRLHEVFALRQDIELLNQEIELLEVEVAILQGSDLKNAKKIAKKVRQLLFWTRDFPEQSERLQGLITRLQVILTSQSVK